MARNWTDSQKKAMMPYHTSVLVSAAAGSGKTSVLTERIIRNLLDEEHPQDLSRLLVVTFTRAAAAELKSRITTALTEAISAHPDRKDLSKQLLALGNAQISTIDSFFQKGLKEHGEVFGLSPTFRVADESEMLPLKKEILNRLLEEFYRMEDVGSIQQMSENRFACAVNHLMSNRSDGKLEENLLKIPELYEASVEGVELLQKTEKTLRESAEKDYFQTPFGDVIAKRMLDFCEESVRKIKEYDAALSGFSEVYVKVSGVLSEDLHFCLRLQKALEEKSYESVQTLLSGVFLARFPVCKERPNPLICYKSFRSAFRNQLADLKKAAFFTSAEISDQMKKTAELLEVLYPFYSKYESQLLREKIEKSALEFEDIRRLFYRLLVNEDGTPSKTAAEIASQYDAVYIDEYQDVDSLQDRIFSLVGGNHRYMVGDIKQSIYAFRGSEPSIFSAYRKDFGHGTANDKGLCLFMSENFRCDSSIVNFANRVCSFLFSACPESMGYQKEDDLVCGKQSFDPDCVNSPKVRLCIFDKNESFSDEEGPSGQTAEEDFVANEIVKLLKEGKKRDGSPICPSDIAILTRYNTQAKRYADALEAHCIPVSAEQSKLADDPLMTDILNLLFTIDNPYRDIPLTEYLISSLGGWTLEEISAVREAAPLVKGLFDAMELYAEGENDNSLSLRAKETAEWIAKMQELSLTLPADKFLRNLFATPKLSPLSKSPVFLCLYDQARTYQKYAFCGLFDFLQRVCVARDSGNINAKGLVAPPKAVQILTIHHSKGLEFPIVFLTATGAPFVNKESQNSLRANRKLGLVSKLYSAESGCLENTALCDAVTAQNQTEQMEEEIRVLYVALTRARERLMITGTPRSKLETLHENAGLLGVGDRFGILSSTNYLSWILSRFLNEKDESVDIEYPTVTEKRMLTSLEIPAASQTSAPTSFALRLKNVEKAESEFSYSDMDFSAFPSKVAASKLRKDLLDTLASKEEGLAIGTQLELLADSHQPSFEELLQSKNEPTATDIGTATHHFLEFCDFANLKKNGVEAERTRLLAARYLSDSDAEILNVKQLESFRNSDIMEMLLCAKEVLREQEFGILLPMKDFTQNANLKGALGDKEIFVQGSIDLLIRDKTGRLILVDYKTDRISPEERSNPALLQKSMWEKHQDQLACYGEAVFRLFGQVPDDMMIYSLPGGKTVSLSPVKS